MQPLQKLRLQREVAVPAQDTAGDGRGHQQRHDVRAAIPQTGQHSPDDAVRRLHDLLPPAQLRSFEAGQVGERTDQVIGLRKDGPDGDPMRLAHFSKFAPAGARTGRLGAGVSNPRNK